MLFYGNLLGLLITENRPTFKNKSNVSIGWTHTQWLSKLKMTIYIDIYIFFFCKKKNRANMTQFYILPREGTYRNKEFAVLPLFGHEVVHVRCKLILGK